MNQLRAGRRMAHPSPARGDSKPSVWSAVVMLYLGRPVDALLRKIGLLP